MKFIKTEERSINTEQIVSLSEDDKCCVLRMSNCDVYRLDKKKYKKTIEGLLNADIQLSSKRATKGTDRDI